MHATPGLALFERVSVLPGSRRDEQAHDIMQVGSIGGGMSLGGAGLGGGIQAGAVSPAGQGAVGGVEASLVGNANPNVSVTANFRMQALTETLQDFSSAEILIALMMMNGGKDKDDESGGSAAVGMLAGMAMASQLGMMNGSGGGLGGNGANSLSVGLDIGVSIDLQV